MQSKMLRTECSYEGVKIDKEALHMVDQLRIMFDLDVGEEYEAAYDDPRLCHGLMGMETEIAEFLDALKKHFFYHKPLDVVNLLEELGDMSWYVAILEDHLGRTFYGTRDLLNRLAQKYGSTLEQCEEVVVRKLMIRYPDKFTNDKAETRDLKTERQVLEDGH